ncbi:MAG: hypothetical protein ACJ74Z_20830 [Bryobacteraceae bacterium]
MHTYVAKGAKVALSGDDASTFERTIALNNLITPHGLLVYLTGEKA